MRVIVRDLAKAQPWVERGADAAVVDLGDRAGLTAAIADSDGFTLLPFDPATTDVHRDTEHSCRRSRARLPQRCAPRGDAVGGGGRLSAGTGLIVGGLHDLEEALRSTGTVGSEVRSGHFQEKVSDVLDAARYEGIYPVFASGPTSQPTVATRDIGAVVAQVRLAPPRRSEAIDLDSPVYTERQVAEILGRALSRQLEVVTIPKPGWAAALVGAGFSPNFADALVGLYDADDRGLLVPRGDRTVRCDTGLETTLAQLVGAAV